MCFFEAGHAFDISRADAIRSLAAVGGLPLIGSLAPRLVNAAPLKDGAATIAFLGATAFLGDDLTRTQDTTIVVTGNRIVAAGPSSSITIPAGAKRVVLSGKYMLPGLIDSHVHFFQSGGLFTRPDAIDLRSVRPYTEELAWIDAHLPDTFVRYLRAGITSVSDVGGPFWNYDVRARAASSALAPRIAAAGPLISSIADDILSPHDDPPIVKIVDPASATALVEREAQRKTEYVKLWWIVTKTHPAAAFRTVASAAMQRSKELQLRVAVHALELETATLAAETGTDVLVHSVFDKDVDDGFVALLRGRGIILCPTIRVFGGYQTTFAMRPALSIQDLRLANPDTVATLFMLADIPGAQTPEQRTAAAKEDPEQSRAAAMRNLRKLHGAGVTIAAGTDAGNIGTLHASSLYAEMQTMVDSGLTAHETLVTATLNGARHMAREADLGTIAAGKVADLVVLDADPTDDIRNVAQVHLTIKDGLAYRPSDLDHDTAEQTVQRVFNALNAHNATALAELYVTNASLSDRGKSIQGSSEVGAYFARFFTECPEAHVKVAERSRRGSDIVVRADVSNLPNGATLHTESAFTLKGKQIARTVTIERPT